MKQRFKIDVWTEGFVAEVKIEDMQTNEVVRGITESYFGMSSEDIANEIGNKVASLFKNFN